MFSGKAVLSGFVMKTKSGGTHEGKIPGGLLLGECPVLAHGWT